MGKNENVLLVQNKTLLPKTGNSNANYNPLAKGIFSVKLVFTFEKLRTES